MSRTGHCRRRAARRSQETTCSTLVSETRAESIRAVLTHLYCVLPRRQKVRFCVPLHDQAPGRARKVACGRFQCLSRRGSLERCQAAQQRQARLPEGQQELKALPVGKLRPAAVALRAVHALQASAPHDAAAQRQDHAPVELPVASGLLLSEEVAQRGPSCFLHVPKHQQRAATRRALSDRVGGVPRSCQTHSGSRLPVSEALLLANDQAPGNAHSAAAHTTKRRSIASGKAGVTALRRRGRRSAQCAPDSPSRRNKRPGARADVSSNSLGSPPDRRCLNDTLLTCFAVLMGLP